MTDSPERRVECPRPHAHHHLFSFTADGDIAIKCRGCHEVYTMSWIDLEKKRQQTLARIIPVGYTISSNHS